MCKMVHPCVQSQRKIRKNLKKKEQNKRKVDVFREMRGGSKRQRVHYDDDF